MKAYIFLNDGRSYSYETNNNLSVYEAMMSITGNDHEISADAAGWCELAHEGEVYSFREGVIEIKE